MIEEPIMATAEEAAQRVYAKRLEINRESMKRKRAEESQANRESMKRKRAEEWQQQRENRLVSQREITKRKRAEESQEQPRNFRLTFRYNPVDDYSLSRCVQIGTMSKIQDEENYILKCRELFHQFVVDMYAKIESERLLYIRLNQTKLRSEQYIHLQL